uniref:Uncharacterized protein n=1 Tax=Ectopseudomonas oleovorans TaxID=301 RepID=A0A653B1V7_ECTOL
MLQKEKHYHLEMHSKQWDKAPWQSPPIY